MNNPGSGNEVRPPPLPPDDTEETSQWASPPPAVDHVPQRGWHPVLLQRGYQLSAVIAYVGRVPAPPRPLQWSRVDGPSAGTDASHAGKP